MSNAKCIDLLLPCAPPQPAFGSRNGRDNPMPLTDPSIPDLMRERASEQPNAPAYTFVDHDIDPSGFPESLTWSQVHRQAQVIAEELRLCGSPGDRAAILAPQGFDYIVAFLGALQAGFIAVPLSVPQPGSHDERVSSALRDSRPVVILTTSAVVGDVTRYVLAHSGHSAPSFIEVDLLDPESPATAGSDGPAGRAAYLQYTSGSTRTPTGVVITHRNVIANFQQMQSDYFHELGNVPPPDTEIVSWLPFYHDMGLIFGICAPIIVGRPAVLMSPMAFLQKPARWIQSLARYGRAFSAAPNFAFDLAVRRTTDHDMAGLDLSRVLAIVSGSERVHPATLRRFHERFARFNLSENVIRPSYGLAEATLYVTTSEPGRRARAVRFGQEELSVGYAKPCESQAVEAAELVSYGAPRASMIRIVNPDSGMENPAGAIGEIWVHGDNVAMGYWRNPGLTRRTFGAKIVNPSSGTPAGRWLRTGDLGVISDGELFIVGRIKDLLIVDGRNYYPDDIEATAQQITAGRVAAVSVADGATERLVVIIEFKQRGDSPDAMKLRTVKRQVTSAISRSHRLYVADLVVVPQGSIPITTSGKIRRSACLERYRQNEFTRLDDAS
jgi:long-chain fatty acid adenylase/transferase FadD26